MSIIKKKDKPSSEKAAKARKTRNDYLDMCDKITNRHRDQVDSGTPLDITTDQFLQVLQLKQDLRDITEQPSFPNHVEWPEIPEFLNQYM